MESFEDITRGIRNLTIVDAFTKCRSVLSQFERPLCSVSGGSDSDCMVDMVTKLDTEHKVIYFWIDTGVEYQANKDHLDYLEERYGIEIVRFPAVKRVPTCTREYGQPFISKMASEYIEVLQKGGFGFENLPLETLQQMYPDVGISGLKWWCNTYSFASARVSRNKWLKEFMSTYPPTFQISAKCCDYAKKISAKQALKDLGGDLTILGLRKFEGGVRAASKTCFSQSPGRRTIYRPLFWFTNNDKAEYEQIFGVKHSLCYTRYGLNRTGCVGCPFNRWLKQEQPVIEAFEPKIYEAACNIFKDSYEYTTHYKDFCKQMNRLQKEGKVQPIR